jgi:tRNA nucleotidyltransferase (CCA-adding enzyme)
MSYPECLEKVVKQIEPSPEEREKISQLADKVRVLVQQSIGEIIGDETVKAEYHGSYRHDTWLRGKADLDLFVLFSKRYALEEMSQLVKKVAHSVAEDLNAYVEERYASHPYYTLVLPDGQEVELVPAYRVSSSQEVTTPVDRTQLHTEYLERVLSEKPHLKAEIRLFKKLLMNLDIYGAEQSVHGFSGYLAEILVTYFGGLENLLLAAANWRPGRIFIPPSPEARKLFQGQPIVVIDPVDHKRNAAASVSQEALSKLILIGKLFSENKDIMCCLLDPPKLRVTLEELVSVLNSYDVLVAMAAKYPKLPEDALLAKLQRIARKSSSAMESYGFRVLRTHVTKINGSPAILFFFEHMVPSPIYLHMGPPVWHPNSVEFVKKWASRHIAPIIIEGRVAVLRKRIPLDPRDYLLKALKSYPGFSWEINKLRDIVSYLPQEYYVEVYRWVTGVENWTMCIQ